MRLIDADEVIEHVWRDRLDSRELIADMINNAPTVKAIPLSVIEKIKVKIKNFQRDLSCSSYRDDGARIALIWACQMIDEKVKEYADDNIR